MPKRGIFRRVVARITQPVKSASTAVADAAKKSTEAVKNVVTAPFVKKPKPAKKTTPAPKPAPTPVPKPRPNPVMARELLHAKLHEMYWLQKKYDSAAMSKRINKMTDAQVYAALGMDENDIESAARVKPSASSQWASPDDPTSNVLWYHGGETMVG